MKNPFYLFICGFLLTATPAARAQSSTTGTLSIPLKNDTDSASYYLGYSFGANVASSDINNFNIDALARGVQEAINHGKKVDDQKMQEIQMYLNKYFTDLQAKASMKALKEGQDFLEANRKKKGVVTLPGGLQYRIIKGGTGIKPTKEGQVDVVYHGTLIDGTVFESIRDKDTATFNVSQVVPGFSEALTLMNEGSIWEIYIPSELGYGANVSPGGPIKPNSVLIFELNLVKVHKN